VKELLVNPIRSDEDKLMTKGLSLNSCWCDEEELPEITRCMVSNNASFVSPLYLLTS
jgi:hypothetical protein